MELRSKAGSGVEPATYQTLGEATNVSCVTPETHSPDSERILREIGYPGYGGTISVLGSIFHPASQEQPVSPIFTRLDTRRTRVEVLKLFPTRQVVDFLIQHFLAKVNWLFEEVYIPTFLERYDSWWDQDNYQADMDIQFGVLILRLCVNSLQFVPADEPKNKVLEMPLDALERLCNSSACKLDAYHPRKPSLLRVQQLLFYIATLSNDGNIKESYHTLAEAVKEARDIDLLLEDKWTSLTEFDKESRRKTFWNLYVWDRCYCAYLGRWLIIPDFWFDVKLPLEKPYTVAASDLTAPTIFTDVLLNIKICLFMQSFISAPAKKAERLDPATVSSHATKFQQEFIDKLPPAFRLQNPETKWDSVIPNLARKRAFIQLMTWGVVQSMHRGFLRSFTTSDDIEKTNPGLISLQRGWAESHRKVLANASIHGIDAGVRLHKLMGGGSHRYFTLAIAPIETAAVLAICLISDAVASRSKSGPVFAFDHEMQQRCYNSFLEGKFFLELLSQRSVLAQKGVMLLRKLSSALLAEGYRKSSSSTSNWAGAQIQIEEESVRRDPNIINTSRTTETTTGDASELVNNHELFTLGEWETISQGADFSWFFEDSMLTGKFDVDFSDIM